MADQNILVRIGADVSNLTAGLNRASRDITELSSSTRNAFDSVGKLGAGVSAAGLALAGGLGYAVKTAADFDTSMRKAGAIAGANATELDKMKAAALDLGASTSQSASGVATAMTDLAAKGFNANQVIAAMPGIISAAEASGEDLSLTADTIASSLNIFGLAAEESSHVADVLAKTANMSAAGISDLGYVLKYAGAPAAALGISLEEVAAAAGIMTNAGLDGSSAGTSLRASLLALNNPAKAQAKIMDKLGFSMTDNEGKTKSLSQIVGDLSKSLEGQTEAQKVATLAKLVGTEAVSGFLSLTKAGPAEIDKMSEALRNSGGASAEAAAQMKAGIGGTMENLSGSFETLAITVGTALIPAVQTVANKLSELANWFNSLPSSVQSTIATVAALAAVFALVVGPLLIFIGMIPSIIGGFQGLVAFGGLVSGAFGTLAGVLGVSSVALLGIIGAVIAVGAILVWAYNNVGWFRDGVNAAWAQIVVWWNTAISFISGITQSIMSSIAAFIGRTLNDIKAWWSENGAAIMALVNLYWNGIVGVLRIAIGIISMIFQTVFPIIVGIVKVAWSVIQMIFSTALNLILGTIGFFAKLFTGDIQGAMDTAKNTFKRIWDDIKAIFNGVDLAQIGKNILQGLINGISSMVGQVKKAVQGVASAIPEKIKSFLGIHSPSKVTFALGEFTGDGLINGIQSKISEMKSAAANMANAVVPNVPAALAMPGGTIQVSQAFDASLSTSNTAKTAPAQIHVTMMMDSYEVGRATAPVIDAMQANQVTLNTYMTGAKR